MGLYFPLETTTTPQHTHTLQSATKPCLLPPSASLVNSSRDVVAFFIKSELLGQYFISAIDRRARVKSPPSVPRPRPPAPSHPPLTSLSFISLWSVIKLALSADDKRSVIQRLLGKQVAALRGDMKLGRNVLRSAWLSVFEGRKVAERVQIRLRFWIN